MRFFIAAAAVLVAVSGAAAQQAQAPTFATTKVEGTDNVYIFRYQNHQSMFVVTSAGVIATDPISYGRPQAATTYVDEIRKITKAPIKYLIYSHHHYDHIAGGKPFKDAGATIIAHRRAKERLAALKGRDVVIPDQVVDAKRTLKLGGTTLELIYTGRNHSDSSLVMLLPKEKVIFAVDFNALGSVPSRLAHQRLLSGRMGSLAEAHARAQLGTHDPGPSRTRRPPRHQKGYGTATQVHDRHVRRREESLRRGQVLQPRRHRVETT
jgi:hypothetical protein